MKHPLYYIIVAMVADFVTIGLCRFAFNTNTQLVFWYVLISALMVGVFFLSVSMLMQSRKFKV